MSCLLIGGQIGRKTIPHSDMEAAPDSL